MRQIGRLIAGTGADFQNLVGRLYVDGSGHAAHQVRPGNGHAVVDVEEGALIDAVEVLFEHELLARREQEGVLVAIVEDVLVGDHVLEAIETQAEELRILAAVLDHPFDELLLVVHRRRHRLSERHRHIGQSDARSHADGNRRGGKSKEITSFHLRLQTRGRSPISCPGVCPLACLLWRVCGVLPSRLLAAAEINTERPINHTDDSLSYSRYARLLLLFDGQAIGRAQEVAGREGLRYFVARRLDPEISRAAGGPG